MFIRDSRRSYRTYSYAELILITNLCLFGTPVGVTELIFMQILYLFRFLICCTELILITDLFSFETPVEVIELILMQNLYLLCLFRLILIAFRSYIYNRLFLIQNLDE